MKTAFPMKTLIVHGAWSMAKKIVKTNYSNDSLIAAVAP